MGDENNCYLNVLLLFSIFSQHLRAMLLDLFRSLCSMTAIYIQQTKCTGTTSHVVQNNCTGKTKTPQNQWTNRTIITSVICYVFFALYGVATSVWDRTVRTAVHRRPDERAAVRFVRGAPWVQTSGRLNSKTRSTQGVSGFIGAGRRYGSTYDPQEADNAVRQRAAEDHWQHDFAPDESE